MEVIARGNGNYIDAVANRIAHENGYTSMWLFCEKPILKQDREYVLFQGEDGFLTVGRV